MIMRAKDIWAALKFALSRECNAKVELNAEGEHKLERLLKMLKETGHKMDESEVADWRGHVAIGQYTDELLADLNVEVDEIIRQERESEWRREVRRNRKSIRSKICFAPFVILLPVVLWMCGARVLSGFAAVFLIGWVNELIVELGVSNRDAEDDKSRRTIFIARRAGNREKEVELMGKHIAQVLARANRSCGEEIEFLIQQSNYEHRNQSLAHQRDA